MNYQNTRAIDPSLLQQNLIPSLATICQPQFVSIDVAGSTESSWEMQTFDGTQSLTSPQGTPESSTSSWTNSRPTRNNGLKFAQAFVVAVCCELDVITGNQNRTRGVEPIQLISRIEQITRPRITVSKSFSVPREEALAKSLLVPSGAYLSWLEMFGDDATK